ncbi:MAG TPA: DinB family protein, partial [Gemmatimonadales bacterium]|nr:DinB family protein [Gemmatimonadales bacterium]
PAGNCMNWVLGHLLHVYDRALPMLGQQPVLGTDVLKHYARGGEPIREGTEALDFQQLVTAMSEAAQRMDAGLAAVSPDLLDQPAPMSPTGNPDETVRSLLTTVMWHQAYHTGQTAVLRRIAGKEGAIR